MVRTYEIKSARERKNGYMSIIFYHLEYVIILEMRFFFVSFSRNKKIDNKSFIFIYTYNNNNYVM